MLLVFVLALIMPFSLADTASYCEDGCNCCTANQNLAQISWAHKVNSNDELQKSLQNDKIQMIEADVVLGTANPAKADNIPIMAHPPDVTSDLSLETFLKKVAEHNNAATKEKLKGIKLDFKTIEALQQSIPLLKGQDVKAEVWINSDIIAGPGKPEGAINAKAFFKAVADMGMEKSTLSLGWTTDLKEKEPSYTKEQVDAMFTSIQDNNVPTSHPITFAVRAAIAVESIEILENLLKKIEEKKYNVTFTLWSGEKDKPNVSKVQDFITKFTVKKVYVDVPEQLKNQLKLDSPSGASNLIQYGLLNMAAFLFALFFKNSFF